MAINSHQWAETENPLWGLTTNPRNPAFSPGGSTGGEGPLLALHGSLIGFGTDIGGSIRIPQSVVGLYGLKPSVSINMTFFPCTRPPANAMHRAAGSPTMAFLCPPKVRNTSHLQWDR